MYSIVIRPIKIGENISMTIECKGLNEPSVQNLVSNISFQ